MADSDHPSSDFDRLARSVMSGLTRAMDRLLRESRAGDRATDVIRNLLIDKTLAWHVVELAKSQAPLLAAEHVPGEEGVRILLDACEKRGLSPEARDEVVQSVRAFRQLLADYAGDRRTLDSMLSAIAGGKGAAPKPSRASDAARKTAFRANAAIHGIRARTTFQVDFTALSTVAPNTLDFATARGFLDITRLREDAPFHFSRTRFHAPGEMVQVGPGPQPLDPTTFQLLHAPILAQFSSKPLPGFAPSAPDRQGICNRFIASGPVGRAGAFDFASGEYARGFGSPWADKPGEAGEVFSRSIVPAEWVVFDWLLHRNLVDGPWRGLTPKVLILGELHSAMLHPAGEEHKSHLAGPDHPASLGPADLAPSPPGAIRHRELLEYVCSQMEWNLRDFVLFRLRVPFPPIPATLIQRMELPSRPELGQV